MHWESKILLNCPSQERSLSQCRRGGLIRGRLLYFKVDVTVTLLYILLQQIPFFSLCCASMPISNKQRVAPCLFQTLT